MRCSALALAACALIAAPVHAQPPEELFVHGGAGATASRAAAADASGAVISRAEVGLRIQALFAAQSGVARRVALNTGRHTWTAVLERVDVDAAGFRSWVGAIEGIADSHVVFSERDGVLAGLINALGTTYQVRSTTSGLYVLEEIDLGRLPGEADPVPGQDAGAHARDLAVAADDGSTFDLLLLYTPNARAQRGGTPQIEALASQVVSDTNTALARSGIAARVRLVGTRELALLESPQMAADLATLRASPEARALRDLARADLVQLLVSSPDPSSCGVGFLLTSVAHTTFDAYSVADIACVPQYTPTHEMGHNMGAHHAPEDGASGALFPYSYGFKDPARGFRTVMAYSCAGVSCARVPNFSNPVVAHNGAPTGSASQHNARSIAEAAPTVANFRQSAVPPALTPPGPPTGLRSTIAGNSVTVAWDPVLADLAVQPSAATAYVLQAGTAPGLANLFNANVGNVTSASGVLGPGTYFWRVLALNSAGPSLPSAEAQFTIGCASPAPPVNFTSDVKARVVTLTWSESPGSSPLSYILEAGSAAGLADLVVSNVGANTLVVTPAPPGTYYVRVRAQNSCGTSVPSSERIIVVP